MTDSMAHTRPLLLDTQRYPGSLQVSRGFNVVCPVISHFNELFQLIGQFPVSATSVRLHSLPFKTH